MELSSIFGLPAHPLIVHAVVVLVPLAAIGAVVAALSARARSHIGWLVAALAVLDVVLVPLATGSGEALEEQITETALVERHTEMGEQLLPWVIGVAVGVVALMLLVRAAARRDPAVTPPAWAARWVSVAVVVVVVVASAGTLVQVARIGHSGAKASWSDVSSAPAVAGVATPAG